MNEATMNESVNANTAVCPVCECETGCDEDALCNSCDANCCIMKTCPRTLDARVEASLDACAEKITKILNTPQNKTEDKKEGDPDMKLVENPGEALLGTLKDLNKIDRKTALIIEAASYLMQIHNEIIKSGLESIAKKIGMTDWEQNKIAQSEYEETYNMMMSTIVDSKTISDFDLREKYMYLDKCSYDGFTDELAASRKVLRENQINLEGYEEKIWRVID
jgi:hypothetical protein